MKHEFEFIADLFIEADGKQFLVEDITVSDLLFLGTKKQYYFNYTGKFHGNIVLIQNAESELPPNFFEKMASIFQGRIRVYTLKDIEVKAGNIENKNFDNNRKLFIEYKIGPDFVTTNSANNRNGQRNIFFGIVIDLDFLTGLYKFIFRKGKFQFQGLDELIKGFRKEFLKRSVSLPWELDDFINSLSSADLQWLLKTLLSNNMIEETMLGALVAGLDDAGGRIFNNLSKNVRRDVRQYTSGINYRWIEEVTYLVRNSIAELIRSGVMKFKSAEFYCHLKDNLEKSYIINTLADKSYAEWLAEAEGKDAIEPAVSKVPALVIAESLITGSDETKNIILEKMTEKAKKLLLEDIEFIKKDSTKTGIYKAQVEVIKFLRDLYFSRSLNKDFNFIDSVLKLSSDDLGLIIDETGILQFSRATIELDKKSKKALLLKLAGVRRNTLTDIYSGTIKFKSAFGEQTIMVIQKQICKLIWQYRSEGKIN